MNGKKYYTVGEAAEKANTTSETLRHYDRIGLVRPSKKDEWTNYRYYTDPDIVRINTVRLLQMMDIPLSRIKEVLEYEDLESVIAFLEKAEKHADQKIRELREGKAKIRRAISDYRGKLALMSEPAVGDLRIIGKRMILLSPTLSEPSLDNLWNYLGNFADLIKGREDEFSFMDQAGIYEKDGIRRMFAICDRYADSADLLELPEGRYLVSSCMENEREKTLARLKETAEEEYGVIPSFSAEIIIISGILHWNYEIEVPLF